MSFGYDANGRMVKSTKTSQPDANSVYDAAGMRVAECVNNVWRILVYDVGGKLIAEYGGPATSGAGGLSYVMQDWQGSTRVVTNAHGFVKSRNDYTAFGEDINSGTGLRTENQGFGSSDSLRQKYGLTERDDATGLDHTWFRKHETQAGRWTSPDPYNGSMNIGDPQSFNRYSYVQNQPTDYIDPSGLVIIAVPRCTSVDEDGPTWEDDETIHIGTESHEVCTWEFIDFGGGGFDYGFEDYPGNFDPNFGGGGQNDGDCGVNPITVRPGFQRDPKGEPGNLRPGVGGKGHFGAPRRNKGRRYTHTGVDISGVSGETSVWAFAPGKVVSITGNANDTTGYGLTVTIDHGGGYTSSYSHLSSTIAGLKIGDTVGKGLYVSIIGTVGQSGNASGQAASEAHVHFEVRLNGRVLNPEDFLNSKCPNGFGG